MIYARAEGESVEMFAARVRWLQRTVEVGSAEPSPVRSAWAEWLGGYPWTAWGTLTFKHANPTHEQLDRAFVRFIDYTRTISVWGDTPYFLGHEVGAGGRAHLHVLLGGLIPDRSMLWSWWFKRYGRCEVRGYDPQRGAAAYVSKYVTKGLGHYDLDLGGFKCQPLQHPQPRDGPSWLRTRKRKG